MRLSPSIPLRPFLLAALLALVSLAAGRTAVAESAPPLARAETSRAQRPIADDVRLDQYLAVVPAPKAAEPPAPEPEPDAAPAPPPAPAAAAEAHDENEDDEGGLQIAAVGPIRSLRTTFQPRWPTRGIITTYFGETGSLSPRGHAGIDVAAPEGTPILAMDDGEVTRADFTHGAYGGLVILAHTSGYETWYGHMSRLNVEPGDQVTRGDLIGRMGSTGLSTGSHLHFEVRQDGELRDPLTWLAELDLERNM